MSDSGGGQREPNCFCGKWRSQASRAALRRAASRTCHDVLLGSRNREICDCCRVPCRLDSPAAERPTDGGHFGYVDRKPGIPEGEWRVCLASQYNVEPAILVADVGPHFRAENSQGVAATAARG